MAVATGIGCQRQAGADPARSLLETRLGLSLAFQALFLALVQPLRPAEPTEVSANGRRAMGCGTYAASFSKEGMDHGLGPQRGMKAESTDTIGVRKSRRTRTLERPQDRATQASKDRHEWRSLLGRACDNRIPARAERRALVLATNHG